MKLNRQNYEEYFILYLDNELGSEDRRMVEVFADENPDLKAELDMLIQTKLTPDTRITFADKESLLFRNSSSINMSNYQEWLLSYIDDELTALEVQDVERFVAKHPDVKRELELFQKAKLRPETIAHPDKSSLYRREEKVRVITMKWWRIAAAAVLLIGISTTAVVLLNNKKSNNNSDIVAGKPKTEKATNSNPSVPATKESPVKQELPVIEEDKEQLAVKEKQTPVNTARVENNGSVKEKTEPVQPINQQESQVLANNDQKKPDNNLPTPENNPNVTPITGDAGNQETNLATNTSKSTLTNSNKEANATHVTTPPSDTYNNQEYASGKTEDNPDAVFAGNNEKKNKFRGFFRKVTRTFEKRTNIKATDGDDRLLIAGLAIKLN